MTSSNTNRTIAGQIKLFETTFFTTKVFTEKVNNKNKISYHGVKPILTSLLI